MQKIARSHAGLHAFGILQSCKLCSFGSSGSLDGRSHGNPWCFLDEPKVSFSPTLTVELTHLNLTCYSAGKRTGDMWFHPRYASFALQSCPPTPSLHVPCGMSRCRGHPRSGCQQLPVCPLPVQCTHINMGAAERDASDQPFPRYQSESFPSAQTLPLV